jgi:hypothetical protein
MTRRLFIAILAIASLAAFALPASSGAATARHFDATVISKNAAARTFKANVEHRGVMRFKVTRSTRFERVAGFAGIARGAVLEVIAKRSNGRWVAISVERPGRGGDRGRGRGRDD